MSGLLVLVPSVHVIEDPAGLRMDDKFREGLVLHAREWDGPMRVVIRRGTGALPFSSIVDPADLPCDLVVIDADAPVAADALRGATIVLAAADDARQLDLPAAARAAGAKLVYAMEYDLGTRLRIARLDLAGRPLRLARSWQWLLTQEWRRRRALKAADAMQANGYPAAHAYGRVARDTLVYLDGRMELDRMADEAAMAARAGHRGPLRILSAGRLAPMKGAQDLLPFARALRDRGFAFTLDIFGDGPLAGPIARQIADAGLGDIVRLRGVVDFATGLVPAMRDGADLFLAPHRQSDPSCAYIEAMACGLPVLGSDNRMWRPMAEQSKAGWVMPVGKPAEGAALLASLSRDEILAASRRALDFARDHDADGQFRRRMDHLRRLAD